MQVPRDPVAVGEDSQPLRVLAVLGEFQRDAACAANVWTISTASGASGIAPVSRPTVNTPRTSPGAPSGRMMAGPSGMCSPRRAGHPLVVAEVLQDDRLPRKTAPRRTPRR